MVNRLIWIPVVLIGVAIAYVDSRPKWDDAGIIGFALLLSAALFAGIIPRVWWLVALSIGIWIPAYALVKTPSVSSLAMLIVLIFPFTGAYIGVLIRRVLTS